MRAVHFGAGSIGRGFIGLLLHRAGYAVTFVDVADALVARMQREKAYEVREVGATTNVHVVDGVSAINSRTDPQTAARAVAEADVVTCSVGASALRFIAPVVRRGVLERDPAPPPLAVMACENAVGASDRLRDLIVADGADPAALAARTVFANTAVDRIVPVQESDGIHVTVEDFFEWTIEATPFGSCPPPIAEAHFVDDLTPFIERKLFTANTAHAATAYHGILRGITTIDEALRTPVVRIETDAVLRETSAVLIAAHGFDPDAHAAYVTRVIDRFSNPALPDTCVRIGRHPLRKISRDERIIGPAARLAEAGRDASALVRAFGAALRFDVPEDDESVRCRQLLASEDPATIVIRTTGIGPDHPLFAPLERTVIDVLQNTTGRRERRNGTPRRFGETVQHPAEF